VTLDEEVEIIRRITEEPGGAERAHKFAHVLLVGLIGSATKSPRLRVRALAEVAAAVMLSCERADAEEVDDGADPG
jgi:hypothetical protein